MWYVQKEAQLASIGRCRRHAPTMSGYPVVFHNDWCGDHKLDENKLEQSVFGFAQTQKSK